MLALRPMCFSNTFSRWMLMHGAVPYMVIDDAPLLQFQKNKHFSLITTSVSLRDNNQGSDITSEVNWHGNVCVLQSHIMAAKAVASTLRTSLGPNGEWTHTSAVLVYSTLFDNAATVEQYKCLDAALLCSKLYLTTSFKYEIIYMYS